MQPGAEDLAKTQKKITTAKLYVSKLPRTIEQSDFEQIFARFDPQWIEWCALPKPKHENYIYRFGFVICSSVEAASQIYQTLDRQEITLPDQTKFKILLEGSNTNFKNQEAVGRPYPANSSAQQSQFQSQSQQST